MTETQKLQKLSTFNVYLTSWNGRTIVISEDNEGNVVSADYL